MTDSAYRENVAIAAVALCAAFAGCNLFIGLSMGPYWLSLDGPQYYAEFWAQFQRFLFTIMPLFLGSFAALVLALRADAQETLSRRDWKRALACYAMVTLVTAIWHLPINLSIGAAALDLAGAPPSEFGPWIGVFGTASIEDAEKNKWFWLLGHLLRILLAGAMTFFAMRASTSRSD